MLILNLLLLMVTTASARAIEGFLSQRSLSTIPLLSSLTGSQQKCVFTPGVPARYPQDPSQIPLSAWPIIVSILNSQTVIRERLTSSLPSSQNIMQSLDLGRTVDDVRLEGVILGWVFSGPVSSPSKEGSQKALGISIPEKPKLRRGGKQAEEGKELECLDQAVRKVGERRQMDGVMEFERGRLSFLVYRVD